MLVVQLLRRHLSSDRDLLISLSEKVREMSGRAVGVAEELQALSANVELNSVRINKEVIASVTDWIRSDDPTDEAWMCFIASFAYLQRIGQLADWSVVCQEADGGSNLAAVYGQRDLREVASQAESVARAVKIDGSVCVRVRLIFSRESVTNADRVASTVAALTIASLRAGKDVKLDVNGGAVIMPGETRGSSYAFVDVHATTEGAHDVGFEYSPGMTEDEVYEHVETVAEKLKATEEVKNVFVVGRAGEGKSTLIKALTGVEASPISASGTGTINITETVVSLNGKTIRCIDTPGFDDGLGGDSFNMRELERFVRSSYYANLVIFVSQKGQRLGNAEKQMLRMYKRIYADELTKFLIVLTGRKSSDPGYDSEGWKRVVKNLMTVEGLIATHDTVLEYRAVPLLHGEDMTSENGRREYLLRRILASPKFYTGETARTYRLILRVNELRNQARRDAVDELFRSSDRTVARLISDLTFKRDVRRKKKPNGLMASFGDTTPVAKFKGRACRTTVEIRGDTPDIVAELHRLRWSVDTITYVAKLQKLLRSLKHKYGVIFEGSRSGERRGVRNTTVVYRVIDPGEGIRLRTLWKVRQLLEGETDDLLSEASL